MAQDFSEASALALKAGTDLNLGGEAYEISCVLKAIKKGRLSVEDVDRAVGRILRIKSKFTFNT